MKSQYFNAQIYVLKYYVLVWKSIDGAIDSYNLVSIEIKIQTIFKMRCSIENFLSKTKKWDMNGQ